MTAPDRLTRVNELLKREIADYLERDSFLKDGAGLVSILGVSISCNLRTAVVSVSVLGSQEAKKAAMERLAVSRVNIQKRVARDVTLKFTPVLRFVLDENVEKGDKILGMIREMEKDAE